MFYVFFPFYHSEYGQQILIMKKSCSEALRFNKINSSIDSSGILSKQAYKKYGCNKDYNHMYTLVVIAFICTKEPAISLITFVSLVQVSTE